MKKIKIILVLIVVAGALIACSKINRDDLNILVRRKDPYSWTMNLGNKWSWIIMCAELLVIVITLSLVL